MESKFFPIRTDPFSGGKTILIVTAPESESSVFKLPPKSWTFCRLYEYMCHDVYSYRFVSLRTQSFCNIYFKL